MTADPLRGDPESPEVQSVRQCARLLSEPEPAEWAEVLTPDQLAAVRRGQVSAGVLTVATALAVSAPILTGLLSVIMLTRRSA